MVSELRSYKGIMEFIKKISSHLKKGFKNLWNLLLSSKEVSIIKDGGLFSALSGTFQEEDIWVIESGAIRSLYY